jgi:hypothetical protein
MPPIPVGIYCNTCQNVGPQIHKKTCDQPNELSWYLTEEGIDLCASQYSIDLDKVNYVGQLKKLNESV